MSLAGQLLGSATSRLSALPGARPSKACLAGALLALLQSHLLTEVLASFLGSHHVPIRGAACGYHVIERRCVLSLLKGSLCFQWGVGLFGRPDLTVLQLSLNT